MYVIVYIIDHPTVGLLICTLISENQGLEKSSGHLICILISENQGLEKLRSVSNLRKISGPAHLDFFSVCHLDYFSGLWYKSSFF